MNHVILFINSNVSRRQGNLVILLSVEKTKLNLTALASPFKCVSISSEKCMIRNKGGCFFGNELVNFSGLNCLKYIILDVETGYGIYQNTERHY